MQDNDDVDDDQKREVGFNIELLTVEDLLLEIQIHFDDPLLVSSGNHRDILVLSFDLTGLDATMTEPIVV